ncbi:hypothetical protein GWI33_002139 [Rhynchophorus ferrugineus]|uniref:Uncharacterized protein n=1 Tax=Rhynchophorus ferrugineus TaxID=354439 RepID=A0A834HL17_RHYFE|nr:hypothetical protein GWI33_002139 [Rhynchophorus ferrugineus]
MRRQTELDCNNKEQSLECNVLVVICSKARVFFLCVLLSEPCIRHQNNTVHETPRNYDLTVTASRRPLPPILARTPRPPPRTHRERPVDTPNRARGYCPAPLRGIRDRAVGVAPNAPLVGRRSSGHLAARGRTVRFFDMWINARSSSTEVVAVSARGGLGRWRALAAKPRTEPGVREITLEKKDGN